MTTQTTKNTTTTDAETPQLFKRLLVGIDRSPESLEASRQAAILAEADASITLLGAWEVPPPAIVVDAEQSLSPELERYRQAAENALALASAELESRLELKTKVVPGFGWQQLIDEADADDATLIAIGSHGKKRMRGILGGTTGTVVIHKAHCSVLVARPTGRNFPRRIVVGLDGSPESAAAFGVAQQLATRFGGEVRPVVAYGGVEVDLNAVAQIVEKWEGMPMDAVTSLVGVSNAADLLVVGSRGLHGVRALGSVSERVAHQAHCSTLIVRPRVEAGDE
jgi:nucleotide-binding universal stress UspA family protein